MVGGIDWNDHNTNLQSLLQRTEDHKLTLRKEKCDFGKTTLNFYGHMFTADGLKPSPDKIKAVQECTTPKSKEELVLFLQMLVYLSRYISNFSSRFKPLRRLTIDKANFRWTKEQQEASRDMYFPALDVEISTKICSYRYPMFVCGKCAGM